MAKPNLRFIGGILFIAGGALSTIGAFVFDHCSETLGADMSRVGLLLEGLAFILAALGFRGASAQDWASWALIVGGGLYVIQALFSFVGVGLAGLPADIYGAVAIAALLAGAIRVSRSRVGGNQPRGALLLIAVVLLVNFLVGLLVSAWWVLAILGLVYVGVGVVFVRNRAVR